MRSDFTAMRSDALLTGIKPTSSVKAVRRHLDFSSGYDAVLFGWSDDYWDRSGAGIVGDSFTSVTGDVGRAMNRAAAGGTDVWYFNSGAVDVALPSTEWNTATATGSAWALAPYSRPGMDGAGGNWTLWYLHTDTTSVRYKSSGDMSTWAAYVSVGSIPSGWSGAALAGHENDICFCCYLVGNRMYIKQFYYSGSWQSYDPFCVAIDDDFVWSDTHYFDVEDVPGDSTTFVVTHQLSPGVSCTRLVKDGVYSEPYVMSASDREYAYQQLKVASISSVGNYLYAHAQRGLVSTEDRVYTPYWVILRSSDGKNWATVGSTGVRECRGKVHTYNGKVMVVSPTTVMQTDATFALGTPTEVDISDEVSRWIYRFDEDKTGEVTTEVVSPSDISLLTAGQVLRHYYAVGAHSAELVSTTTLDLPARQLTNRMDTYKLLSRGPLKALDRPSLTDSLYASGKAHFHDFWHLDVAASEGLWNVTKPTDGSDSHLRVTGYHDNNGNDVFSIATAPYGLSGNFVARCHFYCITNTSPVYLVFWYKDLNDYWTFGHNSSQWVLRRMEDGATTTLDTYAGSINADAGYWLYVTFIGNVLKGYISDDSGATWTEAVSYTYVQDDAPVRSSVGVAARPDEDDVVRFGWLYYREAAHDYTRGRRLRAIFAQAGATLDMDDMLTAGAPTGGEFADVGLGFHIAPHKQRDVDVEASITPGTGEFGIVMGATTATAGRSGNLSAWLMSFTSTAIKLYSVSEGGTKTLRYSLPYAFPSGGTATVRVTCHGVVGMNQGTMFNAWVSGQFAAGFFVSSRKTAPAAHSGTMPETGYVGSYLSGDAAGTTYTIKSFPEYGYGDYTWRRGQSARSVVVELLRGTWMHLVEQADGTIKLQEDYQESDPTYQHTVMVLSGGGNDRDWASVFRVEGAELYVEYAHSPLLDKYGERGLTIDLPDALTEDECLAQAVRAARYSESLVNSRGIRSTLDPAVEPGDLVHLHSDVEGTQYDGIVQGGRFEVRDGFAVMTLKLREHLGDRSVMTWGQSEYWDTGAWG